MPVRRRVPLDEYVLPLVRYRTRAGVVVSALLLLAVGIGGQLTGIAGLAVPADPTLALGWPWMPSVAYVAFAAFLLAKLAQPLVAVTGTGATLVLYTVAITGSPDIVAMLAFFDCIYAAMLDRRPRVWHATVGIAIATGAVLSGAAWLQADDIDLVDGLRLVLLLALLIAVPAAWGTSVRQRDELLAAETERADAVAHAAAAEREAAVRDERTAMARELHDELAAKLSAIALHAAALAAKQTDGSAGDADAASVRAMRSASVEALEELRQLIRVLTSGREDDAVAVGIDDVDALRRDAERFAVDLDAHVDVPQGSVGVATSHALMRIARESLVNAARHAPGERVRLRAAVDGEVVTLKVENALAPVATAAGGNGLGTALMAQRWRAVGGSGSAGETGDGRWVVRTVVPRAEVGR